MPQQYTPEEVIKVLESQSWQLRRGGSRREPHVKMKKEGERLLVTVPLNKSPIPRGTMGNIIRNAGLTRKQFDEIARRVL